MRKYQSKRLTALLLALVLYLGLAVPMGAADTGSCGVKMRVLPFTTNSSSSNGTLTAALQSMI